jgi:hypothetical protein
MALIVGSREKSVDNGAARLHVNAVSGSGPQAVSRFTPPTIHSVPVLCPVLRQYENPGFISVTIGPDPLAECNSSLRYAERRRFTAKRALKEVDVSDVLYV